MVKTLDLLASVRGPPQLTEEDFIAYVQLVKTECGCVDLEEVRESLELRYKWDLSSYRAHLNKAWESLMSSGSPPKSSPVAVPPPQPVRRIIRIQDDDDEEEEEEKAVLKQPSPKKSPAHKQQPPTEAAANSSSKDSVKPKSPPKKQQQAAAVAAATAAAVLPSSSLSSSLLGGGAHRMPLVLKAGATSGTARSLLLCQVDDPELSFQGDSGAIGRLSVTTSSVDVDIKGRQYQGTLLPGPTVLLLNLAKPVGAQAGYQPVARIEAITNEFCHLEFSKDLLGGMMGEYSGEDGFQMDSDVEDDGRFDSKEAGKKRAASTKRASSNPPAKKKKKTTTTTTTKKKKASEDEESAGDDDSDGDSDGEDDGDDDGDDDYVGGGKSKSKAGKVKTIKISTVTSRRRTTSKGKKGSSKPKKKSGGKK
jgi:outer membrane biosynthesis protein TonB